MSGSNGEVDFRLERIESKLDAIATMPRDVRWLSVDSAANYSSLSTRSIRRLLASRQLKPYKPVKGKIVIDRRELDTFIQASSIAQRSVRPK